MRSYVIAIVRLGELLRRPTRSSTSKTTWFHLGFPLGNNCLTDVGRIEQILFEVVDLSVLQNTCIVHQPTNRRLLKFNVVFISQLINEAY
jgi:hypothetical protein